MVAGYNLELHPALNFAIVVRFSCLRYIPQTDIVRGSTATRDP